MRRHFDRAIDRADYQVQVFEGVGQVIVGPTAHRLYRVVHRAGGGNNDDQRAHFRGACRREYFESARTGHHDIDQGHGVTIRAKDFQRALAVSGLFDDKAGRLEAMPQYQTDSGVVVSNQY